MIGRLINNKLEIMWREVVVAYNEVLFQHLLGETEGSTIRLSQDSQSTGQVLRPVPFMYDAWARSSWLRPSARYQHNISTTGQHTQVIDITRMLAIWVVACCFPFIFSDVSKLAIYNRMEKVTKDELGEVIVGWHCLPNIITPVFVFNGRGQLQVN